MTDDRQQPLKFRSPGSGGKGSETPKGRQLSPEAALQISDLLGDMTRSRDMLIEALHLIKTDTGVWSGSSGGAGRGISAGPDRGI